MAKSKATNGNHRGAGNGAPGAQTSKPKPKPTAAKPSDGQDLRRGRTPDKAPTKPAKKVYGSTGRKDLKQSSRMADALKTLKVRKYKK